MDWYGISSSVVAAVIIRTDVMKREISWKAKLSIVDLCSNPYNGNELWLVTKSGPNEFPL